MKFTQIAVAQCSSGSVQVYALGDDGHVYEYYGNGAWGKYPMPDEGEDEPEETDE